MEMLDMMLVMFMMRVMHIQESMLMVIDKEMVTNKMMDLVMR